MHGDGCLGPRCETRVEEEPAPVDERPAIPPAGLRERDWDVLQEVAHNTDGQVGFQGLKRRLDLHPEALRRVLKRLVEDGYVEKTPLGYALAERGAGLVSGARAPRADARLMPVAFLLVPSHLTAERVVQAFVRRWFEGLHWYGLSQGSGESTLTWLTHDGTPVRLRVGPWGVRIEAAVGDADPDARLVVAAPLVAAVADLLRARNAPARGPLEVGDAATEAEAVRPFAS